MTTYAAPERPTSKRRNLSRRAVILLVAGLLVPACLLAIAKAPVHADPSSNPVFATLQEVQNAINAALAPINSAIASLQQQQTTQAQQISTLQSSSTTGLTLYDASGDTLGSYISSNPAADEVEFYNPTLGRVVQYSNGGLTSNATLDYTTSNCTGQAYVLAAEANAKLNLWVMGPRTGPDQLYVISNQATNAAANFQSRQYSDGTTVYCISGNWSADTPYQSTSVSLPFPFPLRTPFSFH